MGQATRTTKLFLHLGKRDQGGANTDKQAALTATVEVLNGARSFYIDFFLAHAGKLAERVSYYSEKHLEMRERAISAHELLTWAEACTVETKDHPHPWEGWNFNQAFHLPQKRDQGCHRQGEVIFGASSDLGKEWQKEGSARMAWSSQPPDTL
jgi:hypothetical protein